MLPAERKARQLQSRFDQWILATGNLIALIGLVEFFISLTQLMAQRDWQEEWNMAPSTALGLFSLGIASKLFLTEHPATTQFKRRYPRLAWVSVLIPATIGLCFVFFHGLLYLPDIAELFIRNFSQPFETSFIAALNFCLLTLGIWLFDRFKAKPAVMVYGIGTISILALGFSFFALGGYWQAQPALSRFVISIPSILAFVLTSLALLAASLPYRGILLPLFSERPKARVMAVLAVVIGVLVFAYGFTSVSVSLSHIPEGTFKHGLQRTYILAELATIGITLLVEVLALRTIHYYDEAGFLAEQQALAAKRENEIRREIEQKAKELAQSNHDLEQFAAVASHDLQAPLRKARIFSENIRKSAMHKLDDESLDELDRMERSLTTMQDLVTDLLTLSRVGQNPAFARIQLSDVIQSVQELLREKLQATNAQLEIDADCAIDADPIQLKQLFQNLIENALKFQPEGNRPTIRIQAILKNGTCRVIVQDNGIGFKEEYSEKIFQTFERVAGKKYPGTGVGLAICKRIAERHGGTISAQSRPGEGACFTIILPEKAVSPLIS